MEAECWNCGGSIDLEKDQFCPHCKLQLPRFITKIILYDSKRLPAEVHPDPIKRLEGEMAKQFRDFLIEEFIEPIEERQRITPRRIEPVLPVRPDMPLAGMIHHLFVFDATDEIVVSEEFWKTPVDESLVVDFAQQIKELQETHIKESNITKLIGKPLGRGQVILTADSLADDATLREKLDRVTYEFRRVISHEVNYDEFIKKVDDYVTTTLKVSIIGYEGVGKTDIVTLLNGGVPPTTYVPPVAIDIQKVQDARIGTLEIATWDFTGQDRFRKLWQLYFRGSRVIIVVTDSTLENVLNSKKIIDLIHRKDITASVLIIAYKQEYPDALPPHLIEKLLEAKTMGITQTTVKQNDPALALEILSEALKLDKSNEEPPAPKPEIIFD